MLRYCYLLSLLICINNGFSFEFTSNIDSKGVSIGRTKTDHGDQRENLQHRKQHKRHSYDIYDKEPLVEIDVASFINSAYDESDSVNDPYNLQNEKLRNGNDYYGGLNNDILNSNEDNSDMEVVNLQDTSHNDVKHNPFFKEKSDKFTHGFDNLPQDKLDDNVIDLRKRYQKEKKSAVKYMKIPFFSHSKSTTVKVKNGKKRKPCTFHNSKKSNVLRKSGNENSAKRDISCNNSNLGTNGKIIKRSYIERLCPVCRRKFMISKTALQKERDNVLKNKYDIRRQNYEENVEIKRNYENKDIGNEKSPFENYSSDWRRKRDGDDRNIERQKL